MRRILSRVWSTASGWLLPVCLGMDPCVQAQVPEAEPDYVVDCWQTDSGLPHNSVTSLVQTRDRYLWIGTSNGLARFDGIRFTVFRAMDSPGLRSSRILCLFEDAQAGLWAGTDEGGLARYNRGEFISASTADGLSSDTILCLSQDRAGAYWVGTAGGLNRWTEGRASGLFEADDLSESKVYAIRQPKGGPVLFGTQNGLCWLRGERLSPFEPGGLLAVKSGVRCLHEDHKGALWVGGESGLFHVTGLNATGAVTSAVYASKVTAVGEDPTGRIWFGGEDGGLYQATPGAGIPGVKAVRHLPSPISALCLDYEGNVWVGTAGNGLYRLKARQLQWTPFSGDLSEARVSCLFETAEGEQWLVASDQGLYRCHHGRFTLLERLPLPSGVVVVTACAARDGSLWFGTLAEGLFHYQNGTLNQFSERDGLSDSAITVLCADEDGLWIGTRNGGLNFLKDRVVTRFNTPWGFIGAAACVLSKDLRGGLWIGTSGDGLYRLAGRQFTPFTEQTGLPSGSIHSLQVEQDGRLWVGTAKGLARIQDGRVTSFRGGGLGEEAILQLRSDEEGNLWVGSSSRICRLRQDQLEAFAAGRVRAVDAVPYGREDGLPGAQCVARIQSESWRRGRSPIRFFTSKGLVTVGPGLAWNLEPPPVVIESVLVENESVLLGDTVQVPPGKESLRFQYTALSLTAPGKVGYRYLLEGFDRDWSEVSANRMARYPKVPAGRYRFRVIACNQDAVWNEAGASVAIVVAPFWWATAWFRLALVAAGSSALVGLYRMRLARRREIERLRVRIASDLHDDVGSSLWSIALLSRMLARQGTLGPEERQDVAEIHRIAVQTSNSIRDIIWLINPAFDTLHDLVLRLKDFAGTALRGTAFDLQSGGIDLARKLPLDFRQHLFFFLKEALTNTARHARAQHVEVGLTEVDGRWQFRVRDDGVGFDHAAPSGGHGLKSLHARAAKMGATLEIRSLPGQGTTILLTTARP